MVNFDLNKKYPLSQIVGESPTIWIVPNLIKRHAFSEAIILLYLGKHQNISVSYYFGECRIGFDLETISFDPDLVRKTLRDVEKFWVFLVSENTAMPVRIISKQRLGIDSSIRHLTLSVPISPPFTKEDWHHFGLDHVFSVLFHDGETHRIYSQNDLLKFREHIKIVDKFSFQAWRSDGAMIVVTRDLTGAALTYLNEISNEKRIAVNPYNTEKGIVSVEIESDYPEPTLINRRNFVSINQLNQMLDCFFCGNPIIGTEPYSYDDDQELLDYLCENDSNNVKW